MSMDLLLFQSDGMPDAEVLGILETLKIQRQRWIGSFHPESRIRRLALQSSGMSIGAGTHLAIGLIVIDDYKNNVSIGERCSIGANVVLMSATSPDNSVLMTHPDLQKAIKTEPIVIGNDCWIGTGCIVMPGLTIGDKAVVGAGAVVTKDVLPSQVVQGIPGRVARTLS
jgi:maltose O-acetyltransferase